MHLASCETSAHNLSHPNGAQKRLLVPSSRWAISLRSPPKTTQHIQQDSLAEACSVPPRQKTTTRQTSRSPALLWPQLGLCNVSYRCSHHRKCPSPLGSLEESPGHQPGTSTIHWEPIRRTTPRCASNQCTGLCYDKRNHYSEEESDESKRYHDVLPLLPMWTIKPSC